MHNNTPSFLVLCTEYQPEAVGHFVISELLLASSLLFINTAYNNTDFSNYSFMDTCVKFSDKFYKLNGSILGVHSCFHMSPAWFQQSIFWT